MTEYFTKDSEGNLVEVKETLHTQADLDKVVKDRAERLAKQQFGDYEELKTKASKVDTLQSEFDTKLKEKETALDSLTKDLSKKSLEVDQVKLIHEFKLSDDLAEFVTGDTAEEMRTRAEKLSKGVTPSKVVVDKDGKPGGGDGKETDSKTIAKGLFGGKSDD